MWGGREGRLQEVRQAAPTQRYTKVQYLSTRSCSGLEVHYIIKILDFKGTSRGQASCMGHKAYNIQHLFNFWLMNLNWFGLVHLPTPTLLEYMAAFCLSFQKGGKSLNFCSDPMNSNPLHESVDSPVLALS